MKHTPGPWVVITNEFTPHSYSRRHIRAALPEEFGPVADITGSLCPMDLMRTDAEEYANAHLISAAPDLLEALLVQMDATRYDYACRKIDNGDVIREIETKYPFLLDAARTLDARIHMIREHADKLSAAALAKARGEGEASRD